ncbi:MAG TPA: ATP-binding cassette domain-containing protein [Candidatus Acidoferrum sp.]|nr:ATP-binding cassette domain-containing protein [Candidatus Acidoferrum sp.]
MSAPAIVIDSLEKWFPPAYSGWRAFLQPFTAPTSPALRDISLEVAEGEAVALLGANGAGKTTLLRVLATLLLPTRGRAQVDGHDAVSNPAAVRRRIGYHAGRDLGFYSRLTGRQNLRFFGRLNHLSDATIEERTRALSEQFQMGEALDRQTRLLSSGTIQRLSLLRALLHQPKVLLLDEPTRSLDAIAALEFRRFLKTEVLAAHGTSILFASHSLPEIELLADRVAILQEGALIAFDTPAGLRAKAGASTLEQVFFRLTGRPVPPDVEARPA